MTDPTQPDLSWEAFSGRDDPEQRFRIYRLCECEACNGTGKDWSDGPPDAFEYYRKRPRCTLCRGEGRVRELVATCASPEAVGVALCTLGAEGEFDDCPVGVLDTEAAVGRKWVLRPWQASPSARNVSDAARVLATARKKGAATA